MPRAPDTPPLPPHRAQGPSMLDLVRLSREVVFPPGGQALYRRIGTLTEMEAGTEVLDAACGRGVSLQYLAESFGVSGVAVDVDPALVREAERRRREEGGDAHLSFETAQLDDLPFRDGSFD